VESEVPRMERQVVAFNAHHSKASVVARSNKRMADDNLTCAASDLGSEAKRHKASAPEQTPPGAVPMPTLASAAATAARTPLASARSNKLYTTEEEATMFSAYKQCMESRRAWSVEMDALAAQLGRTPTALKQRCVNLWWKQLWREQHR
jgi:hypothetical protein